MRTLAMLLLVTLLVGCSQAQQYQSRAQGPFSKPVLASSNAPRPIANLSPLRIPSATATPAALSSDEPKLIPPKPSNAELASKDTDAHVGLLPPFKRKPPEKLPSPFAPKETEAPKQPEAPKPVPTENAKGAKNLADLKALLAVSDAAWKATTTYEGTLTRREMNPKGQINSEVLLFQFRREPMSVYTSENGKGRETIYNPTKHEDKIHIKVGKGELLRPGSVIALGPDDPLVKAKARYSVREAGFGRTVGVLGAAIAKLETGKLPADALTFDGEVKRDEFTHTVVGVTHKLQPNEDALMPLGGTRVYFFEMRKDAPSYGMPVLVIATDPLGREQEYYLFEKVKSPANLTDADFDPARLGKK